MNRMIKVDSRMYTFFMLVTMLMWATFILSTLYFWLANMRLAKNIEIMKQEMLLQTKKEQLTGLQERLTMNIKTDEIVFVSAQQGLKEAEYVTELEDKCEATCELVEDMNYIPTEEERQYAYRVAYAEAGTEDSLGQTLVINIAINNMRERGYSNLIEEFTAKGRYSTVIKGEVYLRTSKGKFLVTEDDITEELKEAVDEAFRKDYSEELLKEATLEKARTSSNFKEDPKYYEGGALYFYNPYAISDEAKEERKNIKVDFQHGNHVFYRVW